MQTTAHLSLRFHISYSWVTQHRPAAVSNTARS